ncbi:MAG: DUF3429 family protein [Alphaproteobacteria bacterium]|nr:DUF3429 family protein [Alphaproteobacteria bacterium]
MTRQRELSLLGYAGLIPFVAGTAIAFVDDGAHLDAGLTVIMFYGGIIASYMAGMGAGALVVSEKPAGRPLLPGMLAALVAWIVIMPSGFHRTDDLWTAARLFALAAVFLFLLTIDLKAVRSGGFPDWYGALRIWLSFGACLALAVVAVRVLTA